MAVGLEAFTAGDVVGPETFTTGDVEVPQPDGSI